jgi:hypothetical protein
VQPMTALHLLADARDKYGSYFDRMYYTVAENSEGKITNTERRPSYNRLVNHDLMESFVDHSRVDIEVQSDFSEGALQVGDIFKRVGNSCLRTAEVFVVRPNMCQLIEHATRDMPEQILLPSDPPSDSGIAFFDEGLKDVFSSSGKDPEDTPPVMAVSWITSSVYIGPGAETYNATVNLDGASDKPETYRVIFFTIFYDRDHHLTRKMLMNSSKRTSTFIAKNSAHWPRLLMIDIAMWKYGELPNRKVSHPLWGGMSKRDPIAGRMQAFFALCRQELPSIERYEPTEKEMKWVRRLDMRTNPVSVILLRRKSGRGLEGTEVEWSHRWLVRGHWRQQWYPTLNEHRLIYINPHVKGPESKPFIVHDKVNILGR